MHLQGPAPALPGRGRPLPVPAGGLLGAQLERLPAQRLRLYLDVGSHPEYATAECDDLTELVVHDKAGERILEGLLVDAEQRLAEEGVTGDIYLFKNNTDSAGNSYGCHENYLVGRHGEFSRLADVLIPFLVSRQIVVGAGKVLQTPRGAIYCVSQRAEHIWEGVSSATTRSPPDHQHPRRAARRRRALPAAARHRRRLEHERDDDAAQGHHDRPGAAHDRGRRPDQGHDAGEPDPGHPRDQPRHDRTAQGPPGQRPGDVGAGDPVRVPLPRHRVRRPRGLRTPSTARCSSCGGGCSRPSTPRTSA